MAGQSKETGNIVYTRRRHSKQKHNTICVCHNYTQTKTNNVNKIWTLLQTTGGKDEPNIGHIILPFYGKYDIQKANLNEWLLTINVKPAKMKHRTGG